MLWQWSAHRIKRPTTTREMHKTKTYNRMNHLLVKLYYEADRPSALGEKTLLPQQSSYSWYWCSVAGFFSGHAKSESMKSYVQVFTYLYRYLIQVCVGDSLKIRRALHWYLHWYQVGKKTKEVANRCRLWIQKKILTFFKNENVYHCVTYNETKAQVAERFNRTLTVKYHCLRKCSRGQKLWSTDLAETWHRSCVWWDISKATLAHFSDF